MTDTTEKTERKIDFRYILMGLIPLAIILIYFYFNPLFVNAPNCKNAELIFIYGKDNIVATISEEDTDKLYDILGGFHFVHYDMPSCGFDENICVRFGNTAFSPACDTDPIIQYKTKYFSVTEEEIQQVHKILEKYGAYFPCV